MSVDQALFLETVQQLLSGDNALRNAAEQRYTAAKQENPAAAIVALFGILEAPQVEQPTREQAAVLLRQCLVNTKDEGSIWTKLGALGQADVRRKLLELLEKEQLPKVRRKVADCVQSLGNQLIELLSDARPTNAEAWPELMPTLMKTICDSSKEGGVRADCLWAVKEMACAVWQILIASADQSCRILQSCLVDPVEAVRSDAAALLCALVDNIETREDRKPFAPLIPEVSNVIGQFANLSEPKFLNNVLQALQTSPETVDFFKGHLASHLLPVLTTIAKSHQDDSARKYAFEVILTFLEGKPKTVLRVPNYVEQALEICVYFLLQMEDDVEAWATEVSAENDQGGEDEEMFTFGKEAIDRICKCAQRVESFPAVLEVLKPAMAKLLQAGASEWKQVVVGVVILAQIAEYIDDEATVLQMVEAIKTQLSASHARVRYVAWSAVAQFSEDHTDAITTDAWVAQIMPEFLKGLDDPVARVSLRSMEAFQHYGESVEREDMEPFIQPLMDGLRKKMPIPLYQKKAITFIAVIAGQVDDAFAPYYGQLMPYLKLVIEATLHKVEERTLLGKCFECISLLAKAVGREGFRADAEAIMKAMITATQVPNLPGNDPVKEYMMAASERICSTMKEDFVPFVPHILPGVLEKLTLAPREFNGENPDIKEGDEVNLTLMQEDGKMKVMLMYASEMQDLRDALECIHTYVEELGKAYAPFAAQTAQALLPVFEFSMAEEIRDLAFETWGELCACARQDGSISDVGALVMEFLQRVLPKLEGDEVDVSALRTRADGITTCLKKAGPGILSGEQIRHICTVAMKLMGQSLERREDSVKDKQLQKAADPELEIDEDDGEEQAFRVALQEVAGAIMQHHPDQFVAEGFQNFLALALKLVEANTGTDDKKLALFLICDCLEHLGPRITAHWQQFVPGLLAGILHQDAELRQPACYGISLAAKEQAFAPMAVDAAGKLSEVITQSRKRSKKKSEKTTQACADNALSALVEILMNHAAALSSAGPQLWGVWLSGLPCQQDEQEGEKNHKLLVHFIQQEKAEVVGEQGQNVPSLMAILVDLYKTDMVNEETTKAIGQLTLRLGETRLEQYAAAFTPKQRTKLLRIVREAQQG